MELDEVQVFIDIAQCVLGHVFHQTQRLPVRQRRSDILADSFTREYDGGFPNDAGTEPVYASGVIMAHVTADFARVKVKDAVCEPDTISVWSDRWGKAAQGILDPPGVVGAPLIPSVHRWSSVRSLLSAEEYIR